jgi:hypothetical protein
MFLVEPLEDMRAVLGRDAQAAVTDRQPRRGAGRHRHLDVDSRVMRTEFDGIVEHLLEHAAQRAGARRADRIGCLDCKVLCKRNGQTCVRVGDSGAWRTWLLGRIRNRAHASRRARVGVRWRHRQYAAHPHRGRVSGPPFQSASLISSMLREGRAARAAAPGAEIPTHCGATAAAVVLADALLWSRCDELEERNGERAAHQTGAHVSGGASTLRGDLWR